MVDIGKDEQGEYFPVRRMVLDSVQGFLFLGTELCSLALNPWCFASAKCDVLCCTDFWRKGWEGAVPT